MVKELLLATPGLLFAGVFACNAVFGVFTPGGSTVLPFFLGLASGILLLLSAVTGPIAIFVFIRALVSRSISPRQASRLGLILALVLAPWACALAIIFVR